MRFQDLVKSLLGKKPYHKVLGVGYWWICINNLNAIMLCQKTFLSVLNVFLFNLKFEIFTQKKNREPKKNYKYKSKCEQKIQ